MLVLNLILTIGLLLDGLITNYIPYRIENISLFFPFIFVLTIVIIRPYYELKTKEYITSAIIFGVIYGLLYNHILLLSPLLFLLIAVSTEITFKMVSNTMFTTVSFGIINVFIFNLINLTILKIIGYTNLEFINFLETIVRIIPLNIIYGCIIYLLLDFMKKKKIINRID